MPLVETPLDQVSGTPLLIVPDPQERVLAIMRGQEPNVDENGLVTNTNHVWHPKTDVMAGGDGSAALLNSRGQEVLVADHDDYHGVYAGPSLPKTPFQRAGRVVLCAAAYIPELGLDVRGGRDTIVRFSDAQLQRLRTSGEVRIILPSSVQTFLRRFSVDQQLEGITPAMIDRFLALDPMIPSDAREQEYFADLFLSKIAARIVAPIGSAYRFGHERELLAPTAPPQPEDFMKSLIITSRKHVRGMVKDFTKKLEAQRRGQPIALHLGDLTLT